MANPVIRFWEFDDSAEATVKVFAACDAGPMSRPLIPGGK